jgi:hypothetical protein
MIRFELNNSQVGVAEYLEAAGENAQAALREGMMRAMLKLARYIGEQKLSGQVLKVRSGNLRRAVMGSAKVDVSDTAVTGSVSTDPSSWYGRVQEYGAHIPEVSGKLMVFPFPGVPAKTMRDVIFTMHRRAFDLPARPFMQTALEEQTQMVVDELSQAVAQAMGA